MNTKDIILFSEDRLQYYIVASVSSKIQMILIDTGACFKHMHISLASNPVLLEEWEKTERPNYSVTHRYKSPETIMFDRNLVKELEFYLEETERTEDPMYKSIIIGMNTLDQLDFTITKDQIIIENVRIPRIKLHFSEHEQIIRNGTRTV